MGRCTMRNHQKNRPFKQSVSRDTHIHCLHPPCHWHCSVHHTGHQEELMQVWEKDGLEKEQFNPDVFFLMSDSYSAWLSCCSVHNWGVKGNLLIILVLKHTSYGTFTWDHGPVSFVVQTCVRILANGCNEVLRFPVSVWTVVPIVTKFFSTVLSHDISWHFINGWWLMTWTFVLWCCRYLILTSVCSPDAHLHFYWYS